MKRIGILTSGGDCQGLNAAMRGIAKSLFEAFGDDVEIYGIRDGYRGLIEGDFSLMAKREFSGILTRGGTILGTSRQPFKKMAIIEDDNVDKIANMKKSYHEMGLECLVILGGNGTHKTANLLSQEGLNIITLPKTIDNDLWGTDITFGFHSALDSATDVIDRLHTTATSHGRIFIAEIMGHKAGWLNLFAGLAGGADVILIPEIPYNSAKVVELIQKRIADKKHFSIISVAEGTISQKEAVMKKKEFKLSREAMEYPSISYRLAAEISSATGQEVRVTVPGHIQRGGSPSPYDRVLCTRFGAFATELIKQENYGNMVALKGNDIVPVPLSEVAGKLKTVPLDSQVIQSAREIGISFGD